MFDFANLKKIPALAKNAPAATAAFRALDSAALGDGVGDEKLAEAVFVTAALRAGAAVTHGTLLVA